MTHTRQNFNMSRQVFFSLMHQHNAYSNIVPTYHVYHTRHMSRQVFFSLMHFLFLRSLEGSKKGVQKNIDSSRNGGSGAPLSCSLAATRHVGGTCISTTRTQTLYPHIMFITHVIWADKFSLASCISTTRTQSLHTGNTALSIHISWLEIFAKHHIQSLRENIKHD